MSVVLHKNIIFLQDEVRNLSLNSYNWTSCFLFSSLLACFTVWPRFCVVYCCNFSFVPGHTVFPFFFLSYIVHCNSVNPIISYHTYHIISYHIISYHIISYHIISYHIISYHIISYHIISYHIKSYHNPHFRRQRFL